MAGFDLGGMFSSPEEIRSARINDLMNEQRALATSGGSWDALLGQVAGIGSGFGNRAAETLGGMFGLSTPEEKKAREVQSIMKNLAGSTDPNAFAMGAKQLNAMGHTKEAIALLGVRSSLLSDELTQERTGASKAGTWQQVTKATGNRAPNGEIEYETYEINSRTGETRNNATYYSPFPPKTDWMSQLMSTQSNGDGTTKPFEIVDPSIITKTIEQITRGNPEQNVEKQQREQTASQVQSSIAASNMKFGGQLFGNPEYEAWLQQNFPLAYQYWVERGAIK